MKLNKILGYIGMVLLSISIILTVIDICSFNRSFYLAQYRKNNTTLATGMNEEDLMNATNTLLDYLQDKRDDIVVNANVNGYTREVYDQRETLHMVDVKNLYLNVIRVRNLFVIIGSICLLLALYLTKENKLSLLRNSFNYGILTIFLFIIALLVYALADFNRFWAQFHHLFFTNDLWLLDPNVSLMINMFPEPFFFALVIRIILWIIGILLFIWFILNMPYLKRRSI